MLAYLNRFLRKKGDSEFSLFLLISLQESNTDILIKLMLEEF